MPAHHDTHGEQYVEGVAALATAPSYSRAVQNRYFACTPLTSAAVQALTLSGDRDWRLLVGCLSGATPRVPRQRRLIARPHGRPARMRRYSGSGPQNAGSHRIWTARAANARTPMCWLATRTRLGNSWPRGAHPSCSAAYKLFLRPLTTASITTMHKPNLRRCSRHTPACMSSRSPATQLHSQGGSLGS